MKEPWETDPWKEAHLLYRVEVPVTERNWLDSTPCEYAVIDFPEAHGTRPVCMIWGRYGKRWQANVSGRWLVAHLLGMLPKQTEAAQAAIRSGEPKKEE